MILLLTAPAVTLAEPELSLTDLAARYAEAVGEPVEVPASVRGRAVAIFARNRPWPEIMTLAGEATGFALVREDGKLRLKATRTPGPAEQGREANAPYVAHLKEPRDLNAALDSAERYWAAPWDPRRPEIGRREWRRLNPDPAALSPASLVAARLLARGVRFPPGRTIIIEDAPLTAAEYRLFRPNPDEGRVPVRFRGAFRMDTSLRGAVEPVWDSFIPKGSSERVFAETYDHNLAEPAELADESHDLWKPDFGETPAILTAAPWSRMPRALPFGTVGSVLARWHATDGTVLAAPALRCALDTGGPDPRAALVGAGFRFVRRGEAIVATNARGAGLWPSDFAALERKENPGLVDYASLVNTADEGLRAHLGTGGAVLTRRASFPVLNADNYAALRALGALNPTDFLRLLRGGEISPREQEPGTRAALARWSLEDACPLAFLRATFRRRGEDVVLPAPIFADGLESLPGERRFNSNEAFLDVVLPSSALQTALNAFQLPISMPNGSFDADRRQGLSADLFVIWFLNAGGDRYPIVVPRGVGPIERIDTRKPGGEARSGLR